jgi:hypothetical protein
LEPLSDTAEYCGRKGRGKGNGGEERRRERGLEEEERVGRGERKRQRWYTKRKGGVEEDEERESRVE